MQLRLSEACRGKSYSQGGLNVSHLTELAARHGISSAVSRASLLQILCLESKTDMPAVHQATIAPIIPSRIISQARVISPRLRLRNSVTPAPAKPVDARPTNHSLISAIRDYPPERVRAACQGLSYSAGGLNAVDIIAIAKKMGYTGKNLRADAQRYMCDL